MSSRLRIVVTGLIGEYPLGGLSWHYTQYLRGFADLGHDVRYVEDTGHWPYDPTSGEVTDDPSCSLRFLGEVLEPLGFAGRWAYHCPPLGRWCGAEATEVEDWITSADLLLDVSGVLGDPERYRRGAVLAYVDTDPVFTQIRLALEEPELVRRVRAHDVHLSFGECLEEVPPTAFEWIPTRQPIVLAAWDPTAPRRDVWTSVLSYRSYASTSYCGSTYGQKDVELARFLELPSLLPERTFELALSTGESDILEALARAGWRRVDPSVACPSPEAYRDYVQSSRAEWSVAKNGYVTGRPGWFSERSACYLASGRPVVTQSTGVERVLPVGAGLLTFRTLEEARGAIEAVEEDYPRHAEAARTLAEEHFDARRVLEKLLRDVFDGREAGSSPG